MSDIALWLTKLGLEKYRSAFAEAEIDFAELPSLADEDLKEVGLPVGPRRRVNEAIKRFKKRADAHYIASKSQLFLAQFRIEAGFHVLTLLHVKKAHKLAFMARTLIDQTGERLVLAELHRLEGALALTTNNQDDAEASLNAAVAIARKQGSKSLELRAAIDLANLWNSLGRTEEACTLLKPVHDSIANGDCAEDSARDRVFLMITPCKATHGAYFFGNAAGR